VSAADCPLSGKAEMAGAELSEDYAPLLTPGVLARHRSHKESATKTREAPSVVSDDQPEAPVKGQAGRPPWGGRVRSTAEAG